MSDWKVKDSYKSGQDTWVKIGPDDSASTEDVVAWITLISAAVIAAVIIKIFGVTNGWAMVFIGIGALIFSGVFFQIALVIAIICLIIIMFFSG